MKNKKEKEIIETCWHCGNKGKMEIYSEFNETYDEMYGNQRVMWENTRWLFLKCPVCKKPSLFSLYTTSGDPEYDNCGNLIGCHETIEILYPYVTNRGNGIPKGIRNIFDAALKTVNLNDEICCMSLRMVFEKITKSYDASGKTLEQKIKDLAEKNILPSILVDCSNSIRIIGNIGAHSDGDKLSHSDVIELVGLVEYILNYLYILPAKISKLDKKFHIKKS